MVRAGEKKCVGGECRVWHLPFEHVIAKIALRDLNLIFEGEQFKILMNLKR